MVVSIDLRVSRVTFVLAFLLIVRDLSLTTLDCSGEEESFPASDPPSWTATRDRIAPLQDAARVSTATISLQTLIAVYAVCVSGCR